MQSGPGSKEWTSVARLLRSLRWAFWLGTSSALGAADADLIHAGIHSGSEAERVAYSDAATGELRVSRRNRGLMRRVSNVDASVSLFQSGSEEEDDGQKAEKAALLLPVTDPALGGSLNASEEALERGRQEAAEEVVEEAEEASQLNSFMSAGGGVVIVLVGAGALSMLGDGSSKKSGKGKGKGKGKGLKGATGGFKGKGKGKGKKGKDANEADEVLSFISGSYYSESYISDSEAGEAGEAGADGEQHHHHLHHDDHHQQHLHHHRGEHHHHHHGEHHHHHHHGGHHHHHKRHYDEKHEAAGVKIQAAWRGYQIRKSVMIRSGVRAPRKFQKLALLVDVKNGKDLPDVNTFGGIDPFIELKTFSGKDPMKKKDGSLTKKVRYAVETEHAMNQNAPTWDKSLEMMHFTNKADQFLQVVLWDWGMTDNQAVCHTTVPLSKFLIETPTYDPRAQGPPKKTDLKLSKWKDLLDSGGDVKCTVNLKTVWVEQHTYMLKIEKAKDLPTFDVMGSVDSIIEVRLCRCDPRKLEHTGPEAAHVFWSSRTTVVNDDANPRYSQEFEVQAPGVTSWFFEFILLDDNSPLPEKVGGRAVIPVHEITSRLPISLGVGGRCKEQELGFEKIKGASPPDQLEKAKLFISTGYDISMGKED
eukprot:TRINITY_DN3269_c0_g1_i1.p1 TRINITY_DN3269_c0_g1~~TRINITY_DN3269_c0_g1_i1.p1  ORF type:complete len:646 (+),score=157.03 TRINITY_DN3269_c0_g1_i1:198-2135(+)